MPEVHYNRGLAYRRKGDMEKAAVDFSQSIELDPKFTAAYSNRGFVNSSWATTMARWPTSARSWN